MFMDKVVEPQLGLRTLIDDFSSSFSINSNDHHSQFYSIID
jgi:hypothetical protein